MSMLWHWLDKKIFKLGIAFLLFFIPLYPKLPLVDIKHTWVYIRLEDLLIAFLTAIFVIQLVRKKASLKTPLSGPILIYWLVGGVSLIFSILVLSSQIPHFFPHLAFLHFLRRIEYMILFFIAFAAIKKVEDAYHLLAAFVLGLTGVIFYGLGQKFFGWPAFLTMNEEFAKGTPLYLPPEARTTSTFAGHYDLAAYLAFALPLLASLILGLKKRWKKTVLLIIGLGAYILLLFTASRISFAVYLAGMVLVLFLHKKKWLIIPVILLSLFLMKGVKGTSIRFGKTLRVQQVVYDSRTGRPVATLDQFLATPTPKPGSEKIQPEEPEIKKEEEELPLGTGFLEIPLLDRVSSPSAAEKLRLIALKEASEASHLATISGEFLVKRALVYDISLTTRLQGEWPKALKAFQRNFLLGSGYSSVGLATDNDYLRLLAETGILGLVSFLSILFTLLLIVRQVLKKLKPGLSRSVVIGIASGIFGLCLNAFLIDIFEASKVAYILWAMVGIMIALYSLAVKKKESLVKEAVSLIKEPLTQVLILALVWAAVFYSALDNYFTADDFTWLRWAATNRNIFYGLYQLLGLKPQGYHLISFLVHFLNSVLVYFASFFLTNSLIIAFVLSLFFLLNPFYAETVFWISRYSGLLVTFFLLLGLYLFLRWKGKQAKAKMKKIKLDEKLVKKRKAFLALVLIIILLAGFCIWKLKKAEFAWRRAGETSNQILRAVSTAHKDFSSQSTLYFIDLPLKIDGARVFSSGLEDGLWFIYRDETLKIKKESNLEEALEEKQKNPEKIYVFLWEEGNLKEIKEIEEKEIEKLRN